jgi:uncharacterized phage-associated protein
VPVNAKAVANEFLKLAAGEGKKLSPMQVLKLVYLAHGWYLAIAGKPLLDEQVEAWKFGPVVPSLYREFKKYGNGPISEPARTSKIVSNSGKMTLSLVPFEITGDEAGLATQVIREVWNKYKNLTAIQLSNLTHLPESPWSQTPNKEINGTDISNARIREYFASLAANQTAK